MFAAYQRLDQERVHQERVDRERLDRLAVQRAHRLRPVRRSSIAGQCVERAGARPAADLRPPPSTPVRDPLVAALALVEEALTEDTASFSDAALSERLTTCAALIERARVVQTLAAWPWQARGVYGGQASSAPCWLGIHTDVTRAEARAVLQRAQVVSAHPVLGEMLGAGRLRYRHLELLAGAATSDRADLLTRDVEVLAKALAGTRPHESWVIVRRWKVLADDALASKDAADQYDRRRLHHSQVGSTWKTDGHFDLTEGELVKRALEDALDGPGTSDDPDPRSLEQRRADALVRIARHWLECTNGASSRTTSSSVHLHVNEAGLCGTSDEGFDPAALCDVVPGGPVARSTARRLLCDSTIGRIVIGATGEVLDLGRSERLFTPAQRRAMIARDGPTCVVPYCDVPADRCHAHHLEPYGEGGATDLANGALLCNSNHHDAHERGFELVRLRAGHYRWRAPGGQTWTTDRSAWGTSPSRE